MRLYMNLKLMEPSKPPPPGSTKNEIENIFIASVKHDLNDKGVVLLIN